MIGREAPGIEKTALTVSAPGFPFALTGRWVTALRFLPRVDLIGLGRGKLLEVPAPLIERRLAG